MLSMFWCLQLSTFSCRYYLGAFSRSIVSVRSAPAKPNEGKLRETNLSIGGAIVDNNGKDFETWETNKRNNSKTREV